MGIANIKWLIMQNIKEVMCKSWHKNGNQIIKVKEIKESLTSKRIIHISDSNIRHSEKNVVN